MTFGRHYLGGWNDYCGQAVLVTAANRGDGAERGKEDTFPDPRVTDHGRRPAQRAAKAFERGGSQRSQEQNPSRHKQ
jgi:hypothetical protein